jgi:tRNA (guanine37-N1)-methyltransferase
MRFDILTIFPEVFPAYFNASILKRAREAGVIETQAWNIRDFATYKHKTTDDTPYGGGAGMVLKIEPIDRALGSVNDQSPLPHDQKKRVIVLSARGAQFTQAKAAEYANLDQLILICGRYEGIDQRVADHLADEEISIGPYVLSGGEIAALAVIEATTRLIPGVLGNEASLAEESYQPHPNPPLSGREQETTPPDRGETEGGSSGGSGDSGGGGGGSSTGSESSADEGASKPKPRVAGISISAADRKAPDFIQNKNVPATVERLFFKIWRRKPTHRESVYWKGRARSDKARETKLVKTIGYYASLGKTMGKP